LEQTHIGSADDAIEISRLDIGLQLDFRFTSNVAIGGIRQFLEPFIAATP
jgi:hypothetical protein